MNSEKLRNILFLAILISVCLPKALFANDYRFRADDHAPIGVMGDHVHKQGEVMLSYRYMYMSMDGLRDGTDGLSTGDVLEQFMVTPTDMDMQMHMFGAMYAVTNKLTMMGMLPYIKKSMNHLTRMGGRFKTTSEGFGDFKLTGLYEIFDWGGNNNLILNLGLSFPH